jgi:serine/threonine protein kinase
MEYESNFSDKIQEMEEHITEDYSSTTDLYQSEDEMNEEEDYFSSAQPMTFGRFFLGIPEPHLIFEYDFLKFIGQGSHAKGYQCKNTLTNQFLAAKVYDKFFLGQVSLGDCETPFNRVYREIQISSLLKHKNCIQLIEVIDDDYTESLILILPFAELECSTMKLKYVLNIK